MKLFPLKDRVFVKYLDDLEYLESTLIALVRQDQTLKHQVGVDPRGDPGDYRRVFRQAKVVAVGPKVDPTVRPNTVVYCSAWDDADGKFPGHAMIRQSDIALIKGERNGRSISR
jgi:hypothetical protein